MPRLPSPVHVLRSKETPHCMQQCASQAETRPTAASEFFYSCNCDCDYQCDCHCDCDNNSNELRQGEQLDFTP